MIAELQAQDMERILMEDPHIVRIHPAEIWKSLDISLELWEEPTRESKEKCLKIIKEFLGYPYIEDDFGKDHLQRRDWWERKVKEHGEAFGHFVDKNALRAGYAYFMLGSQFLGINQNYIGTNPQKYQEVLGEVFKGLPDKSIYHLMPTYMKIEVMKDFKLRVYNILEFLSIQSPASSQ